VNILNCSHLADTGGNGWRTAQAFRRLTDWSYHFAAKNRNYLAYPTDLRWDEAIRWWRRADVVHLRDGFQAQALLDAPDRPTVIHHHGTQFRLHRDELLREQSRRGAIGLAATLDLYLMAPSDVEWMPALYDLEWLAAQRRVIDDGILRIAHAPTNRSIKSTEAFLRAVGRLEKETPVELILIERTAWAECIARKATADIYFDQVALGYGNNAIEAWGMGQAVIAGGAPDTLDEMTRRFGGLPFLPADESSILHALRALADPSQRAHWSAVGRAHAERWHSESAVVPLLQSVYERAGVEAVAA
jgi:hypothetical protein